RVHIRCGDHHDQGFSSSSHRVARITCSNSKHYISIHIGNANTRIAIMEGASVKVIDNSPSLVAFNKVNETCNHFLGTTARSWALKDPTNAFFGIHRLICSKFDDPQMQKLMKMVPYDIVRAPNGDAWVKTSYGQFYSPSEFLEFIVTNAKKMVEAYIKMPLSRALFIMLFSW
ncbi:hypothetical protein IFM89_004821, partial [Coptis chinensis]